MNRNLEKAIQDICKVNGVMYAMDNVIGSIHFAEESLDEADHYINAFYGLWDLIRNVEEDILKIEEDEKVVDVLQAARGSLHIVK